MSDLEGCDISDPARRLSGDPFTLPRFAFALALLLLVAFPDVLAGTRSFYTRDFSNFGLPLAHHLRESYRAGEIPLWNPYNIAGLPFLAQWNTLCLYPGSLIYILFPLPWSLNFFNLLHLYFGGITMFCLARRWFNDGLGASIAGISYAFGGVTVTALMWPNNIAALGWLPLVLLTGEAAVQKGGRHIVFAGLVMALQFLAGAPEIVLLTWVGLAVTALVGTKRSDENPLPSVAIISLFTRLVFVYAIALGLTAAQWLPFLELMRHSQREANYAGGVWAMTWPGLGNFLVPLFRMVPGRDGVFFQTEQQWATSYYCGTTILSLALFAICFDHSRRTRLMIALCAFSLLLALGEHGGIYPLLRKLVPRLGVMRYPTKFIVPVAVLLPLLAGRGVSLWLRDGAPTGALASGVAALAMLSLALLGVSRWWPIAGEDWNVVARSGATSLISLLAAAGVVIALRRTEVPSRRLLLAVLLGLIVFADLWSAHRRVNPLAPSEFFKNNLAALEPRPKLGESRAMVSSAAHALLDGTIFPSAEVAVKVPRQSLLLNANLLEGIPKLDGFFSLYLRETVQVVWRLNVQSNTTSVGALDFLGISHVSEPTKPWQWNLRTNALPFFTLVPRAVFLDGTNALERLLARDFDPRREVILPENLLSKLPTLAGGGGKILEQSVSAHECRAVIEADKLVCLVLSQANYPGWRAEVDGLEVPLLTANFAFQALAVPAGRHEVKVYFRSTPFQIGVWVSVASLLTCLAIAGFVLRSRARKAENSSARS